MYARSLDRILVLLLKKFSLLETFEADVFKSLLKKGMRVADIGANLGYYTLMAAKAVGRQGQVFAFEPEPENFSLLARNIQANNFQNVETVNLAVTNKVGQEKLFFSDEHRGDHRIYDPGDKRKTLTVSSTSLDSFFQDNLRLDVIKIDVEGAEGIVFAGMKKIIEANPHLTIFIEFWPKALSMAGTSPQKLLAMIDEQGFSIYVIDEKKKKVRKTVPQEVLGFSRGSDCFNLILKKKNNI